MLEWIMTAILWALAFGGFVLLAGALPGRECKLYYNSGTFGTPVWTEVTRCMDLSYTLNSERGNVSSRASIWKMEAKALIGLELTFGYRYRQGVPDSVYDAIEPYRRNNSKIEFAIVDGTIATTGNAYLRATYQLDGTQNQPLTDGVNDEFTAFLTSEEDAGVLREPTYVTV